MKSLEDKKIDYKEEGFNEGFSSCLSILEEIINGCYKSEIGCVEFEKGYSACINDISIELKNKTDGRIAKTK